MSESSLVFDIETIPDVELGRRLLGLPEASDAEVAQAMFAKRQEQAGTDFLPYEQHRVVAISAALRSKDQFMLWSVGSVDSDEADLLSRFFGGIDKLQPVLVSWNGSGFDLPVLHYRMLRHGVVSPRYWDTGDLDRDFKWNNYLNRFHARHLDLMDVLAGYQARGRASLEHVSALLGLPGKLGMSGDKVWDSYQAGQLAQIRNYCETDVMNTHLVYLRFQLIRGLLSTEAYEHEIGLVADWLAPREEDHWQEFAAAWDPV